MSNEQIRRRAEEYVRREEDPEFRGEVESLLEREDWDELADRFYTDLSFGTGGLRGVIGGGYNRMNPYNVRRATQGLADYLKKTTGAGQSGGQGRTGGAGHGGAVAIAYDSRNYSERFALEAAKVMAGNGIKTYLFTSLRPTPELSFAVRRLRANAGVVITASHNPSSYNGYKVYWDDGGQIVPPHDKGIIEEVRKVKAVSALGEKQARDRGLLLSIDREIDEPYLDAVGKQSLRPDLVKREGRRLKVVYTPLHGSGAVPVSRALERMGISVRFVEEQKEPDGDFPTVEYPNPEEADALEMAIRLARRIKADLVMGTDPDSDRLGIAVPEHGEFVLLTGNQLGSLLADYIFSTLHEQGRLPEKPALVKTIVTTDLQRRVAESYGAVCVETLTGFKYIAEQIRRFEAQEDGPAYVFGGEESYGYLVGTQVRDKDAVSAAAMTAEMTLYHLSRGSSLMERLKWIYRRYGYFQEVLVSSRFEGQEGFEKITALMEKLRSDPPEAWGGVAVRAIRDYQDGTTLYVDEGRRERDVDLPSSNVLQFVLEDQSRITARPSGTEPKIKFYASCCTPPDVDLEQARSSVDARIERIRRELEGLADAGG